MSSAMRKPKTTKPLAIVTAVLVLLFAALPTTMLLIVGMAPTLGAFIGDTTRGRYLTKCVAGMNMAGVFPYLFRLWTTGHSMKIAFALVTDPYAWLYMYSAAAVGWLLFLGFPGVVAMLRVLNAKRRIYLLREQQKNLINEWGDSILPAAEAAKTENRN